MTKRVRAGGMALVFLWAVASYAQGTTGTISGTVADRTGAGAGHPYPENRKGSGAGPGEGFGSDSKGAGAGSN